MKTSILITLASVAALLTACIPSVNPFYTEKDVVFDPNLLGEWEAADKDDGPEKWLFEKAEKAEKPENRTYRLTVTDKDSKTGSFDARLFKLNEEQFLDLIPHGCSFAENQAELVGAAMFPGHLIARVSPLEPQLKLAFMDFDWLAKYLEKNPGALAHRTNDDSVLLTAKTRDLQRFILKHKNNLFAKPGTWIRVTDNPAGAGQ